MLKEIPYEYRDYTALALIASAGFGPIGSISTAADVASIGGVWGTLTYKMVKESGVYMDKEAAKKLSVSVLTGVLGYYGGCKMATRLFHMIPGAGTLMAMGVSSLANILFTYRYALVLSTILEEGISLDSIADAAPTIISMMMGSIFVISDIPRIIKLYKSAL